MTDSAVGVSTDPVISPGPTPSDPPLVQLLTPEGERVAAPDVLRRLSRRGAARPLPRPRPGPPGRRRGHRAAAAGRAGHLGQPARARRRPRSAPAGRCATDDFAFPTYREHGVAWCRGVDPLNLLGLFRGVNHGGWDPNEKNFHLYTIVIGAQTLHATGYAMGMQKDGAESAVIAYFGDGATSQGDVNEAFICASVFNAPVVFFCQNNQWAISEPIEKQTPHPALPAGDGLRLPRHPGRRQRRARRAGRDQGRAAERPRGQRARPWSRPSPTGWARTRRPTTRPATGSPTSSRPGSSRTRSSG